MFKTGSTRDQPAPSAHFLRKTRQFRSSWLRPRAPNFSAAEWERDFAGRVFNKFQTELCRVNSANGAEIQDGATKHGATQQ
jgi:hypothetical protein